MIFPTPSRRSFSFIAALLIAAPSWGQQPTSQPTLVPGLVQEVYVLPRMPTRLRRLIPGATPAVSRVITGLHLLDKAAFGGHDEMFQMLLRGFLKIDTAGSYAFKINTDDGCEVLIDGTRVVVDEGVHGQDPGAAGVINLSPGLHPILVRYFQADYGFGFNLTWQPAGVDGKFIDISADNLRADPTDIHSPATRPGTTGPATTQPRSADIDSIVNHVCVSPGFGELNEKTGDLLIAMLDSPNQISQRARHAIGKMLSEVNYDGLSRENQGRFLKGFLQSTFSFQTDYQFNGARAPLEFGETKQMPLRFWNGRPATGYRTIVKLDGRELMIDSTQPDVPEIKWAANALAGLPEHLRRFMRRVAIDPSKQNQFNGGGDTIWIRVDHPLSQGAVDSTIAHEIGHVLASNTGADAVWQDTVEAEYVSVSGYGNRNLNEDFAEFNQLYLSVKDNAAALESVRTLFPKRYATYMVYWNKSVASYAKMKQATTTSAPTKPAP